MRLQRQKFFVQNYNWENWFRIIVCIIVSIEFCGLVERERVLCGVLDRHDEASVFMSWILNSRIGAWR
jgi:hypothetical protein